MCLCVCVGGWYLFDRDLSFTLHEGWTFKLLNGCNNKNYTNSLGIHLRALLENVCFSYCDW